MRLRVFAEFLLGVQDTRTFGNYAVKLVSYKAPELPKKRVLTIADPQGQAFHNPTRPRDKCICCVNLARPAVARWALSVLGCSLLSP